MSTDSAVARLLQIVRLDGGPSETTVFDGRTAEVLLPLVKYEMVGAWLWHRLHQTGQMANISAGVRDELREQGMSQAAANLKLVALTASVVELLASHGIRPVLLKGIACCALGDRYPYFRFRPTHDADLLVEPGSSERAWRLLLDNGLRADPTPSVHPDHHHFPTLYTHLNVPIEIHSSASLFWSDAESWSRLTTHAREVNWQGSKVLVPAPTELFWHGVVHSLGDGSSGFRLRSFLTAAALLSNSSELDWDLIGARIERERVYDHDSRYPLPTRPVRRWLSLAAWFGGTDLPAGIGDNSTPGDLARLLEFRRRRLAIWPSSVTRQRRTERWMEEATRAQFGLGLGRLGHWQPKRRRPKRLVSSLFYQLLYWSVRRPGRAPWRSLVFHTAS